MLHQEDFQPEPRSARAVRQFVTGALSEVPQLDDIVLTASELATNAIRHARTPYTVQLKLHENVVRLEVSDESPHVPAVGDTHESHRGLRLVDAASDKWGIEGNGNGKTIWAEFNMATEPLQHHGRPTARQYPPRLWLRTHNRRQHPVASGSTQKPDRISTVGYRIG